MGMVYYTIHAAGMICNNILYNARFCQRLLGQPFYIHGWLLTSQQLHILLPTHVSFYDVLLATAWPST